MATTKIKKLTRLVVAPERWTDLIRFKTSWKWKEASKPRQQLGDLNLLRVREEMKRDCTLAAVARCVLVVRHHESLQRPLPPRLAEGVVVVGTGYSGWQPVAGRQSMTMTSADRVTGKTWWLPTVELIIKIWRLGKNLPFEIWRIWVIFSVKNPLFRSKSYISPRNLAKIGH
jgi:hypothetical protein